MPDAGDIFDVFSKVLGLDGNQQKIVIRVAWVAFVSFHIAWVCGWLAVVGLAAPFADAQSVQQAVQGIREDRIERLDSQILLIRTSQCKATTTEAREMYYSRLVELIEKYRVLSGKEPRVPGCGEL